MLRCPLSCIMNKIEITPLNKGYKSEIRKISALARKIFLLLKKDGYSADIYLADNQTMRKINRIYRKKDKSTNVLSFCEPVDFVRAPSRYEYLGEIYIGVDYIRAHKQDFSLMVAHSILHLFGYDHETTKDRVKMEKKEASLLVRVQ